MSEKSKTDPAMNEPATPETAKRAPGDSPVIRRSEEPKLTAETKGNDPAAKVAAAIRTVTASAGRTATGARSEARNAMLEALVYGDNDLVGLVAYAMHEVNRRDWCLAYEAANGRSPSDSELNAYLVGEQLERRLDTYRRLAEDALAKVAAGDQNLRRLAEGVPELPLRTPQTPPGPEAARAPAPAPVPARVALGATAADKAVIEPQGSQKIGKLIVYLLFLLVAVAGLAWLLRYGMDITQPPR
ncbi:MAG: hypothetical protein LCH61_13795 [Proteobacteria bacterium]|nr:hypothetical protein [Pseudomonadota bacterium]